jgi:hypothetical protein
LELSAPVGFIHKEYIAMHGHTILKRMLNFGNPELDTSSCQFFNSIQCQEYLQYLSGKGMGMSGNFG